MAAITPVQSYLLGFSLGVLVVHLLLLRGGRKG